MISRPTIIFSSIGRTGTNFFAELFNSVCQDCLALHEPDVLTIRKNKALKNTAKQINEIGGKYLWLKIRGSWSLVKISDDRFTGRIDKEFATKKLFEQRSDF